MRSTPSTMAPDRPSRHARAADRSAGRGHPHPSWPRAVADLRDGLDEPRLRRIVVELAPVRDMDVDDPVVDVVGPPRDRVEPAAPATVPGVAPAPRAGRPRRGQPSARGVAAGHPAPAACGVGGRVGRTRQRYRRGSARGGGDQQRRRGPRRHRRRRARRCAGGWPDAGHPLVWIEGRPGVVVGAHPEAGDALGVARFAEAWDGRVARARMASSTPSPLSRAA
jgi:hypothetical protein